MDFDLYATTIPGMSWEHMQHLSNKVRNVIRRGYLKKTYNDGKILRGRVKMGEEMENDKLDILHPIGYISHVKPTDKTEVFTMDVGADASRRVIMQVIGDREDHPQPDEGEMWTYAPGNKKIFSRMKMKKQGGGGGGNGAGGQALSRLDEQMADMLSDTDGQTKDSGRVEGIHSDGEQEKISSQTKATFQGKADAGQGFSTGANFDVKAGGSMQIENSRQTQKSGTSYIETPGGMYIGGLHHARDHLAGGNAIVGGLSSAPTGRSARSPGGNGLPEGTPDGSQGVSAVGIPGTVSLLATAAGLAQTQVQVEVNKQDQAQVNAAQAMTNQMLKDKTEQLQQAIDDVLANLQLRISQLEARVTALEAAQT